MFTLRLLACTLADLLGRPSEPPIVPVSNLLSIAPSALRCAWIGESQDFVCRTTLSEGQLASLITARGLSLGDPATLRAREPSQGCPVAGQVYLRDEPLAIGRAVTFPWVAVFLQPPSPEVCLEGQFRWERNGH